MRSHAVPGRSGRLSHAHCQSILWRTVRQTEGPTVHGIAGTGRHEATGRHVFIIQFMYLLFNSCIYYSFHVFIIQFMYLLFNSILELGSYGNDWN